MIDGIRNLGGTKSADLYKTQHYGHHCGYLQELKDVEADVKVSELGVENLEVSVVDALKDQRRSLGLFDDHSAIRSVSKATSCKQQQKSRATEK